MSVDESPSTRGTILSWGDASDEELQRINTSFSRVPLAREQVAVIDVIPSSTDLDSYWTHMDAQTTLRNFADESQAGVPLLVNHGKMRGGGSLFGGGKNDMPVGRSFTGHFLLGSYTTPRGDRIEASLDKPIVYSAAYLVRGLNTAAISSDDVIRGIESGIIPDASVGMGDTKHSLSRYSQGMFWLCDECGEDLMRSRKCDHWPGMTVIDEDTGKKHRATATVMHAGLNEYSPVWRGSNPTAQMVRAMEDRLERGVLSAADVAELDTLMQRTMSAEIDWTKFKRSYQGVDLDASGDADKAAQSARSKKYGIGIKDNTNVTKPAEFSSVPDSQWGDPVNYRYPMPDKSHADNAASRWSANKGQYTSKEQGIISRRIEARQKALGSGTGKDKGMTAEQTNGQESTDRADEMAGIMDDTTDEDLGRTGEAGEGDGDGDRGTDTGAGAASGSPLPQPVLVRLAEVGVRDLDSLNRLVERATDGDAYKAALIKLSHDNGVRAYGAGYDRDIQEKMLGALTVSELQTHVDRLKGMVRERFRKFDPNDPDDAEAAKLRDQYGGRQTVPHGQRPTGASAAPPQMRADDDIDPNLFRPATGRTAARAGR